MLKVKAWLLAAVLLFLFHQSGNTTLAQNSTPSADDAILVKFKNQATSVERQNIYRQINAQVETKLSQLNIERLKIPRTSVSAALAALRRNPTISFAEPDFIATATEVPNDPSYSAQWGLNKIQAPAAWDTTHGSSSVAIAIADTGIDSNHPDLKNKVTKRANFTYNTDQDGDGHGTHVAGIAAALTNNNLGVAGIGFNSQLMSVKVLDNNGSGYYSWISSGIIWATDNGAKVINLSLSGSSSSQTLLNAVNYAWNKGVVVVSAAGNNSNSLANYPAFYNNTIAVAATDSSDKRASFSSYGSWVDVAAPGLSILSTYRGGYTSLSGTSMATPFVAGLAGLISAQHPDWSNSQIRSKIESTTDNIGFKGIYWTTGRINACKAVDCIVSATPTPTASPTPSPSPSPTPSPSATPNPTPLPTSSPTANPTPKPTASPAPTPTPKPWYCVYVPTAPLCK